MRGIFHRHGFVPLVIIRQIHVEYVTVVKSENDTSITADAPVAFPLPFERMQPIPRKVNVART
jgi:hypothetical protein